MFRTLLPMLAIVLATSHASALPSPAEIAKHLKTLQSSSDTKARVTALMELAKAGQVNKRLIKDAEPAMVKALDDKDDAVRAAAAQAVGMIALDPEEIVPKLTTMLEKDKVEAVKIGALQGLAAMGKEAKSALPKLKKLLKDEDKKTKLGRAGRNAMRAIQMKK